MAKRDNVSLQIKLPEDVVNKIDRLVEIHEFDSRSSFVRKATVEYLKNFNEKTIVS